MKPNSLQRQSVNERTATLLHALLLSHSKPPGAAGGWCGRQDAVLEHSHPMSLCLDPGPAPLPPLAACCCAPRRPQAVAHLPLMWEIQSEFQPPDFSFIWLQLLQSSTSKPTDRSLTLSQILKSQILFLKSNFSSMVGWDRGFNSVS